MPKRSLFRGCASTLVVSLCVFVGVVGCGAGDDGSGSFAAESDEMAARSNGYVRVPCGADNDCKVAASTCNECSCVAVSSGGALAKCSGNTVACVVDPCRGKTPVCNAGQCIVADEGSL